MQTKLFSTKQYHPSITTKIKRLIRNKENWYKKAVKRNDDKTWRKYADYKSLVQKHSRKAHDNYVQDIIIIDKNNKKFWSYVKSQRKENTGIADLINNNKTISDPKGKANLFNEQFSNVFSKPCSKIYQPLNLSLFSQTLSNIVVSKSGVL